MAVGCGGAAGNAAADAAVDADGGPCGTHMEPGILKLANLVPAMGASVVNQTIVHSFTVVNAPGDFTNFDLRYGPSHTAGVPTPNGPRFQTTISGSDVAYQLTATSWSLAPGHVEWVASGGFDTSKGCTWNFPSPLFSYDITAGPDGGAATEAGQQSVLDAPENFDLPPGEAASALDAGLTLEAGASLDVTAVD